MNTKLNRWQIISGREPNARIKDVPTLLHRLSVLLGEGYPFSESIMMLLPHHMEDVSAKQDEIQEKLRNGEGVIGVMSALDIPNSYLVSITIAEHNGHLQDALIGVAKQMRFSQRMQSRLKKLMLYPVTLLLFLIGLFVVYRTYFFPNIEQMIESRGGSAEEGSLGISKFFLHFPDYSVVLISVLLVLAFAYRSFLRKQSVESQIAIQLKIPIWRGYFKLSLTKVFSKYLGSLLLSGFSLQSSLQVLQQQSLQLYLQYCAEQITEKVVQGDSLGQSIKQLHFFQKDLVVFVEHGEKSGYLGKELTLYSELLEERFEEKIQRLIAIVQPTFFVVIALCIIAAYLSLLLPIYSIIDFI